jgi:hypothetical protein
MDALGNFVPKTYNLGMSYSWKRVLVSVSHNYRSAYLYRRTGVNAEYVDARTNTALNLQYKMKPWATLYFDVTDIFNEPSVWYRLQDRARVSTVEKYATRFSAGISGRF